MNTESFNSDQHLSYEELVEYSRGNLSNSEMHRLEQHLIGCELCNDALEGVSQLGYDNASTSVDRIIEATGSKESSGIGTYHYIGIAASILLIAVLGFLFIRTSDDAPMMAEEATKSEEKLDIELSEEITSDQYAIAVDSTQQVEDTLLIAMNDTDTQAGESLASASQQTDEVIAQPTGAQIEAVADSFQSEASIAEAELNVANDSVGIRAADSLLIADVAMDEEPEKLNMARKSAAPAEAVPSEQLNEAVAFDDLGYQAAVPQRGIRAYNRYLRRNLEYPEAAKENSIEGDVILQVIISTDGSILDVIVINSLGYGCDEEAIRLVREGQSWNPATRDGTAVSDQVNVTVTFKQ